MSTSTNFNITTIDGITAEEFELSQFFLVQEFGTSMRKFAFLNQLGAAMGAVLAGYVWCETARYYREYRSDRWPMKVFVAVLCTAMTICQTLGVVNSLQITSYWNDYGHMIRTDELTRYAQLGMISVILGPSTFAFFGLRVWALQGRTILITILYVSGLLTELVLGLILTISGARVPSFNASQGLTLDTLLKLSDWSKRNFRLYKIYSMATVILAAGVTLAILGTIWGHRTKDKTLNRMLLKLALSLLESMVPPIAVALLFSITMIATNGIGGMTRVWGDIAAPFFPFAVLHALLDRRPMQQRLRQIGLNSTIDTSRDVESFPMPPIPALKVETDVQVHGDENTNFWGKDVSSTGQTTFMDVSTYRSRQPLTAVPDSLDLTRRRIRQFHAAWENPVANQVHYSNRSAWGFSLGSTMESA